MLKITGLSKSFGGLNAVNELDMAVKQGEIVGLIGPNGAGKTTVFNLITGFLRPTEGKIVFNNQDVTGIAPHLIARKGMVRTFQQNAFLPDFTVLENVLVSSYVRPKSAIWQAILNTPAYRKNEGDVLKSSLKIIKFLGLEAVIHESAKNLPHGYQRLLGIAIALSADPKLILLDEPLTGMNASEVTETLNIITKMQDSGITVLLVEHNMRAVMTLCNRIVVISFGKKISEGRPEEVKRDKMVVEAYLGVEGAAIQY